MATALSNAIKSCIEDNWSAVTGGTEPTVYGSDTPDWPTTDEWIRVLPWTYDRDRKRLNDGFIGEVYLCTIRVSTQNDDTNKENRLDEMVNELYRIITPTNLTGFHDVDIIGETRRATVLPAWRADLTIQAVIRSTSSAVTPGTATGNNVDAMTMYGAANAAWVPCNLYGGSNYNQIWTSIASNGSNGEWGFLVPLPTVKGTLKLYIAGTRITIQDADVANYVTQTVVYGILFNATTGLDTDNTDKATAAQHTDTFTGVDCSSYDNVKVWLNVVSNAANALDVYGVAVKCYYA